MGIRTTAARVEALGPSDSTLRGTYWFDLRTRRPGAARIKRSIDVVAALGLLALLGPLMLLVAVLIRRKSAGPAIVVQRRIGFRGNEFGMYAFRTARGGLAALPRLFNVLDGTMSLVGPQSLRSEDLHRLPMHAQMRRFSMLPGLTGLWNVRGHAITEDERMQLDREYINDWSLRLDLKILAQTLASVLK